MKIMEEFKQFWENARKELKLLYGKIKRHPLTFLVGIIVIIIAVLLLIVLPSWRVTQFNITSPKDLADAENSYRATLAQILGGGAVVIGIYFAWKNLVIARESKITDRFSRAIEQLGAKDKDGNPDIEIRLGGIYSLERISNESEKDYQPIMKILAAYIRKNSSINDQKVKVQNNVSEDIQAILTVIGKQLNYNGSEETRLDLQRTYLRAIYLPKAHLEGFWLDEAYLVRAILSGAFLNNTSFENTKLILAYLDGTHFNRAFLKGTALMSAQLQGTHFEEAYIESASFGESDLKGANFEKARLISVDFKKAKNLTVDQLSKAKTLYQAQLDPELEDKLRAQGFGHLLDNKPSDEP